ncbi:hypothetical protein CK203_008425 [Vitis vinifera]|uniref:Uncharacterized protein n=1 Tax=Vitis vinifera TaxID=29760 RepID=A0A438KP61_VITVI|nr:hypothetical protein CK203_008425 [Vitis vinifera]
MDEKVQSFFAALRALSRKEVHYGSYATSEQVDFPLEPIELYSTHGLCCMGLRAGWSEDTWLEKCILRVRMAKGLWGDL